MSTAVIPLLAIRKTAMFTPSSFAYLRPHVMLKPPRRAIATWKKGIPGMLLLAKGSTESGTTVSQSIRHGHFQATSHPLWKEHHFRMFRSTFRFEFGNTWLWSVHTSAVPYKSWRFTYAFRKNNFIVPYVFAQYCLALRDIGSC